MSKIVLNTQEDITKFRVVSDSFDYINYLDSQAFEKSMVMLFDMYAMYNPHFYKAEDGAQRVADIIKERNKQ